MDTVVVVVLWAAYCALHSFLISIGWTNFLSRVLKTWFAFYRLFYVVLSLVLLVPLLRYSNGIESAIVIVYAQPWSYVREALSIGCLLLFFWAFFVDYDALSFFGIRQILNMKKTQASGEIKRNGLLGVMRHPMYFALIVYLWLQTFRALDIVVNVVLTAYVLIGTILEEKKLVLEFGESYKRYQQEVPMLVPFLKRKTG